jgi:hypothetical protein
MLFYPQAENIRVEKEKELTFSPNVSATSQHISKTSTLEVFERLSMPRGADTSSVRDPDDSEFTFKPKLNSRSLSFERKFSEPVHLRLQKYADMQQKKLEEEKKRREEAELAGCTFEPYIADYKPKKVEGGSENGQDGDTTGRKARRESREYTYGANVRSARSQSPSGASTASAPGSVVTEPANRPETMSAPPATLTRAMTPTRSFSAKFASEPASPASPNSNSGPKIIRPKAASRQSSSNDMDSADNNAAADAATSNATAEDVETF